MKDFLEGRVRLGSRTRAVGSGDESAGALPRLNATMEDGGRSGEKCESAPAMELVETNGRIKQIIVTCGCGERITLQCTY